MTNQAENQSVSIVTCKHEEIRRMPESGTRGTRISGGEDEETETHIYTGGMGDIWTPMQHFREEQVITLTRSDDT